MQYDAQASLAFVLSQKTHIETAVNKIKRPEIQYPELVPVDTSAPAYAKTVTYFSSDMYGAAEWINGNSDDIPLAGNEKTKFETNVFTAGIGYSYSWEEMMYAQALGSNLPNDDAIAARRAYEEMVDEVALFGAPEKGFQGLLKSTAVQSTSPITGDWLNPNTTEFQILADINQSLIGVGTDTNFVAMADTVIMPYEKWLHLASTPLGDNADKTILAFLEKYNAYTAKTGRPLKIRGVRRLIGAGAGGTDRMLSYRRNPETVKMHIPMPHQFMAPRERGATSIIVPGLFRVGGVDWRLPREARYVDGI